MNVVTNLNSLLQALERPLAAVRRLELGDLAELKPQAKPEAAPAEPQQPASDGRPLRPGSLLDVKV